MLGPRRGSKLDPSTTLENHPRILHAPCFFNVVDNDLFNIIRNTQYIIILRFEYLRFVNEPVKGSFSAFCGEDIWSIFDVFLFRTCLASGRNLPDFRSLWVVFGTVISMCRTTTNQVEGYLASPLRPRANRLVLSSRGLDALGKFALECLAKAHNILIVYGGN